MRIVRWLIYSILPLAILLAVVFVQRELTDLAPAPPVNVPILTPADVDTSEREEAVTPIILIPQDERITEPLLPQDDHPLPISTALSTGEAPLEIDITQPSEVARLPALPIDLE